MRTFLFQSVQNSFLFGFGILVILCSCANESGMVDSLVTDKKKSKSSNPVIQSSAESTESIVKDGIGNGSRAGQIVR